jgi:hypothetical protein
MMPRKKTQIRFDGPDPWDILYKTEYELIPNEGRWYTIRTMLIYVNKDNAISKIKVI